MGSGRGKSKRASSSAGPLRASASSSATRDVLATCNAQPWIEFLKAGKLTDKSLSKYYSGSELPDNTVERYEQELSLINALFRDFLTLGALTLPGRADEDAERYELRLKILGDRAGVTRRYVFMLDVATGVEEQLSPRPAQEWFRQGEPMSGDRVNNTMRSLWAALESLHKVVP